MGQQTVRLRPGVRNVEMLLGRKQKLAIASRAGFYWREGRRKDRLYTFQRRVVLRESSLRDDSVLKPLTF